MYVVLGASGHTGHVVAEKLLANRQKVRAVGRNLERLQLLISQGAQSTACDLTDQAALTGALQGAKAVYIMIPPQMTSTDYGRYQDLVSVSIAKSLEAAEVYHAVVLSSIGADKSEGTGPVLGLHKLEDKLTKVPGLNVLFLRPGYFMENTLGQIGMIKTLGVSAGPLRGELELPMISTRDIGTYAAERLLKLDFTGQEIQELHGQRDISMAEAASVIGKAISRPQLGYKRLPDEQVRMVLVEMGMSKNLAGLMLEMTAAMNSGHMVAIEKRSPENTTPTSYEEFVRDTFVPLFKGKTIAAN